MLNSNPQFTNLYELNFSYEFDSPCIDSGNPELFDPDGTRRDIGVIFYNQNNLISGDCNNDEMLNILDILFIINNCILTMNDSDCDCSDVNEDGNTNVLDVVALVAIILES